MKTTFTSTPISGLGFAPHFSTANPDQASNASGPGDITDRLIGEILDCVNRAPSLTDLVQSIGTLAQHHAGAVWFGVWQTPRPVAALHSEPDAVWRLASLGDSNRDDAVTESVLKVVQKATGRAVALAKIPSGGYAAATILPGSSGIESAVGIGTDATCASSTRCQWFLVIASLAIEIWQLRTERDVSRLGATSLSQLVQLQERLAGAARLEQAARMIVNLVPGVVGTDRMAFCRVSTSDPMTHQRSVEIVAYSGVESIDRASDASVAIRNAVRGAAVPTGASESAPSAHESPASAPTADQGPNETRFPSDVPGNHNEDSVIAVPVPNESGKTDFFLVAIVSPVGEVAADEAAGHRTAVDHRKRSGTDTPSPKQVKERLALIGRLLAVYLQPFAATDRSSLRGRFGAFANRVRSRWALSTFVIAIALFAMMFVPVTHSITTDCALQPVVHRFVAAPYDAVLKESLVQKGDRIHAGQVLARLDGRPLRIELASRQAERDAVVRRRDAARAQRDFAAAQIADAELRSIESDLELIRQRLEHLEVRSPIDGVVIAGDVDRVEGATVELGQALFEIAPLDRVRLDLFVPESDISWVDAGGEAHVKLSAFPFRSWAVRLDRIHPQAELVDDDLIFVAQAELDNPDGRLRPGMKGRAKIDAGQCTVGWRLFHRPYEKLRAWLVW